MIFTVLRALMTRPGWFTALFLALLLGYEGFLEVSGDRKLAAAGLKDGSGARHVEVILAIEPEQFHLVQLQAAGRMIRFEKPSAFLMDVPPAALRELASNYWVAGVRPWAGVGR